MVGCLLKLCYVVSLPPPELDHDADEGMIDRSNKSLLDEQHYPQEQLQYNLEMSDQSISLDLTTSTPDTCFDFENNHVTGSSSIEGSGSKGTPSPHADTTTATSNNSITKNKKSKLKLLGVVPIPGTKKVYKEDRREKKAEKRIQKQARRPAWEANVSTGKY
jgi:hypothetical protein